MGVIIVLVYFGIFAAHLLSLPYSGGPNADGFLSARSQSALLGNQYYGQYQPPDLISRIVELNIVMYMSNATINQPHPYASKWYSWPIMARPIFDWQQALEGGQKTARIYLLGNPLIWWLGLLCVVFIFFVLIDELRSKKKTIYFEPLLVLMIGYIFNLLPYVLITRPAFLYHYFPSFIFMTLMSGFVLWFFFKNKPVVLVLIFLVIIQSFIYFAPLSYGLPLTDSQFEARMWFKSWK